jgi:aerobic carbon-monoxide dehydrogenase large subunit
MSPPCFEIGDSPRRLEDERFLRGAGHYLDDVPGADLAHAAFVRSPHAHARILRIDTARAARLPGVLAVLTHEHASRDALQPLHPSVRENPHTGQPFDYQPQPLLAAERVQHVGELVAMVVAGTLAQAIDAAEAVAIEYQPLDAIVDVPDAGTPADSAGSTSCLDFRFGDAAATDAAFAAAAHVVHMDTLNHRVITNSMEPRGAVARHDAATDCYTLHASTQNVHVLRDQVADALGITRERLRLFASDVGGGFGNRNFVYPEYPLLLWAARRTGRGVKWVNARTEGFVSDHQARDFRAHAALALDADGRLLGLRVDSRANMGAYLAGAGCGIQTGQYTTTPGGIYRIAAIDLGIGAARSNTVPVGVTRGPGFAEAINVIERLLDKAARELGMCRFELRRRNLIEMQDMPWTNAVGTCIDSGGFRACLDEALRRAHADAFERRRSDALAQGSWLGLGLACHVKATGGLAQENVALAFEDEAVVFTTGTMAIGQGHETSFRQILGTLLGLTHEQIVYRAGDSGLIAMGGGHGSSRATYMAGTAMARAAASVIERGRAFAARTLGVPPDAVCFEAGLFRVRDSNRNLPLLELARLARAAGQPLDTYQHITREAMTFPGGCHVAEVAIDPDTGVPELLAYWAVDDYGVQINPMLVQGQMHGAIAQGIGQALLERAAYDGDSGQLLSASFMDYCLPRADDLPAFDTATLETRCTTNPLGVKGCGEAGAVAAFPAINNAIADALAAHGIGEVEEPISAQRIWRAIRNQR